MTEPDIHLTIDTLVLPSPTLVAATKAAVELRRELTELLERPGIEFHDGDRPLAVESAGPGGLANAVFRAVVDTPGGGHPATTETAEGRR